jgi:hypothetical protein
MLNLSFRLLRSSVVSPIFSSARSDRVLLGLNSMAKNSFSTEALKATHDVQNSRFVIKLGNGKTLFKY